jgi:hypothetical protein
MSGCRRPRKRSLERIAAEIRAELRSILRTREELRKPLSDFQLDQRRPPNVPRYYVAFDRRPRRPVQGLRCNAASLTLPDERITDEVLHLAKSLWHLKDRLHQWVKATDMGADVDAWWQGSTELRIAADLANQKKHGRHQNQSQLSPYLSEVTFDTSQCGMLELFYDGSMKDKELLVSLPNPIPFSIRVLAGGSGAIGDVVAILDAAFRHWLPLIQRCGILAGADPESAKLKETLAPWGWQ